MFRLCLYFWRRDKPYERNRAYGLGPDSPDKVTQDKYNTVSLIQYPVLDVDMQSQCSALVTDEMISWLNKGSACQNKSLQANAIALKEFIEQVSPPSPPLAPSKSKNVV
jgi:hypothetical protein